jgi:hypothetical protein
MLCVFISSTSRDLQQHRKAVESVVLEQGWHPVMMEHFGSSAGPTLEACVREVGRCDLLLLIAAFRRGWVPAAEQGGDGRRSVTAYELEAARRRGLPVRALLARESWPGSLWEDDPEARSWVRHFRDGLNQVAQFFDIEILGEVPDEPRPGREFRSLVRKLLLDHRDWLRDQAGFAGSDDRATRRRPVGAEALLPTLDPLLDGLIVPRSELTRLYQRSAPGGWEPPPFDGNPITLLFRYVSTLARAPRQAGDGVFPLLRFIQALGDLLQDDAAAPLRTWLDEAPTRLGLDPAEADRLRSALGELGTRAGQAQPAATCHLLVQVAPRMCEPGRYGVKAWLLGTGEPACLEAGEEGVARDDLPACLDLLRDELIRREIEPERTWVELLLPRELLCADVDQWRIGLDFLESIPLGVEYRLVVRSLERASRPGPALALQARGRTLRRRLDGVCRLVDDPSAQEGDALWIEREDCGGEALYATLKDAQGLVGAVLGCRPPTVPRAPRCDVLNTLFAAGFPVVLWMRRVPEGGPTSLRTEFARLLGQEPMARLPDRVWELRKAAVRSADELHLGRHLSLLWDDPARPSPDFDEKYRLRAPARED